MGDTRRLFFKYAACSHTFFHILNREFGCIQECAERASDLLAGGLVRKGHQCGMLWGSALAVGAESFRRYGNSPCATSVAITATQRLMESFSKRAGSVDCFDITGCDFSNRFDMIKELAKALLSGIVFSRCMNLAAKWAPEAIEAAKVGLSGKHTDLCAVSCASELAKRMGASDEQTLAVAGFAGGMGLSGNACGALAAAIWLNTVRWCRTHPESTRHYFPSAENTLTAFYNASGSEILCSKICGRSFKTIADHTAFIKNGGCDKLISALAG